VNRAFLEKVAQLAEGKSYFLNDPSGLEQIVLRDVKEHTGSTAVEKDVHPEVVNRAEILDGVGIETAPPLRGYVRFLTRPTTDLILRAGPKIRCWCAGNMAWGARQCSPPTPRIAGPQAGWPGRDSTSCGPTSSATCCRMPNRARQAPNSTGPPTSWWWIITWAATCPSRPRFRISTLSDRTASNRR
jgi:hypothetical protein